MHNSADSFVSIVDYGMGNLFSVKQACEFVGLKAVIVSEADDILRSSGLILPGVGAFGNAVTTLRKLDLINPILDFIRSGRPFMGICLGMQLLFNESEEFGRNTGLGVIPGEVLRFSKGEEKVPEVGWNTINMPLGFELDLWQNSPLKDIYPGEYMYFVHSFYCKPRDEKHLLSTTHYAGVDYCSSIQHQNICAFQFHPEKSAYEGLKIYRNWAKQINQLYEN